MSRWGDLRRARGRNALAWWLGVGLAIVATLATMRYREAPTALCLPIPPARTTVAAAAEPARATPLLHHEFRFDDTRDTEHALAVTIGAALPSYRLALNGADLTPATDLTTHDIRDLAPHLHVLPTELLRPQGNVLELTLPQLTRLGPTRLEHVCIGPRSTLEGAFQANWWRMVLVPRVCLMLLIALVLLAVVLWFISGRQPAYLWYALCVMPLLERNLYLSMPYRPGGPLAWLWLDDLSLLLVPLALYHFIRAHWQLRNSLLGRLLTTTTLCAFGLIVLRAFDMTSLPATLLASGPLIIVVANAAAIAFALLRHANAMHRVERRVLIGTFTYASLIGLAEIGYFFLPFEQRWMWSSALATMVLALGLGYLLIRRMAIGGYVLAAATATLADDLDEAIAAQSLRPDRLWAQVAAGVSQRERKRLIRDIHDGFGSRLVSVLTRARRELRDASLQRQIQRALIDMRLMIDALDDSSRTLGSAMARLRHRIEQATPQAGEHCDWQMELMDDVIIGDRNRLIAVYRCLEELLSEHFERAPTAPLMIRITTSRHRARFTVTGGGTQWSATAIDRVHRMIRAVDGDFALQPGAGGVPSARFGVPLF